MMTNEVTFESVLDRMKALRGQFHLGRKIRTQASWLCPIAALLLHETGKRQSSFEWVEAAAELKIPHHIAQRVVHAADEFDTLSDDRVALENALR